MKREDIFVNMLQSIAEIHRHIASILEAKSFEAEKSRNWLRLHMVPSLFAQHKEQLEQSVQFHEQMIEMIDGITKLEEAMASSMKTILGQQDEESPGSSGGLFDLFGTGGGIK
ncbi:MAG TPA: restriction endonuclease subunit S [Bacilli bacterium]